MNSVKNNTKRGFCIPLIYIASFALSMLVFWVEPIFNGLKLDIASYFLFFLMVGLAVVIPFVLSMANAIIKGVKWSSVLVPVLFGAGDLLAYFLTITLYYLKTKNEVVFAADMFILSFVAAVVGLLIGLVIHFIAYLIKRKKEN